MSRKVEVSYRVEFLVAIEVKDGQSVSDAAADIDIPESPLNGVGCSKYKEDSFLVVSTNNAETGEDLTEKASF